MTTQLDTVLDEARERRTRRASVGAQYVASPAFEFFRRGGHHSPGTWRSPVAEVIAPPEMFATVIDGAGLTLAEVAPLRPIPSLPATVGSLPAQGRTTANAIQYPYDNAPPITGKGAVVAPGAAKPALANAFQLWTQPVTKVAGTVNASEEQFDDVPGIAAYIDARLTRAVNLAVDTDLLATIAALPGLTPTYAATGGSNAAALLRQAMVIFAASGYLPDAIVIHPNALWGTLVIAGQELQGADLFEQGALASAPGLYLYGMLIVPSIAQAPATATLGAFRAASQIYWRDEFAVEASNSHVDNFTKNMITLRGERRYAFAAYAQNAFSTVTGLAVLT